MEGFCCIVASMDSTRRSRFSLRRTGRYTLLTVCLLATACWGIGQILRDVSWLSSLLFYIPSPVLVVGLLVAAAVCLWKKQRRSAVLLFVLMLVPLALVLFVENRLAGMPPQPSGAEPLRLVHWNVLHGALGWDGVVAELREHNADLYLLSEFPDEEEIPATAALLGDGYRGIQASNLGIIARGNLRDGQWLARGEGMKAYGFVWDSPAGECRVLFGDMDANLLLPREPRLVRMREALLEWDADLVAGDFNAPRRSRVLSALPDGYAHAHNAVGSGWSYTWPVPLPVYAIDQCIVGSRLRPLRYDLVTSLRSDHRLQVLEFEMVGSGQTGSQVDRSFTFLGSIPRSNACPGLSEVDANSLVHLHDI